MQLPSTQLGPFRINREIGRGGMAVVYHAIDTRSGSEIALKILKPEFSSDPTYIRRFENESKTALRLRHPNIVRAEEAGELDGFYYIALEYISKGTLDALLKNQGGPMSLEETTRLLRRVAMALDYAHNQNVLHRDVKPSNILIKPNGQSLLSDFGVARRIDRDYTMMTAPSQTIGTPAYMSPEQVHHDDQIDQRSDIYSLGVVAYNMLTGKLPFEAKTNVTLLYRIAHETPTPPEHYNNKLPDGVRYALLRVLAKEPAARYASAAEFIDALGDGPNWSPNQEEWAKLQAELGAAPQPEPKPRGNKPSGIKEGSSSKIPIMPPPPPPPNPISDPAPTRQRWGLPILVGMGLIAAVLVGRLLLGAPGDNQPTPVSTPSSLAETTATPVPETPPVPADTPAPLLPSEASPTRPATDTASAVPSEAPTEPLLPTATAVVEAASGQEPTATPVPEIATATQVSLENQANKPATSTPVPDLPTETATPVPTNTQTPLPTATATAVPTRSATPSPKPVVVQPPTSTPTAAPTLAPIIVAPISAATAIPSTNLTVQLLSPNDNENINGRHSFAWYVIGNLPAGYALEPVFYSVGGSAMADGKGWGGTTTGSQLDIDLTRPLAAGTYQWAVLLVETSPYRRHELVSNQQTFRLERPGESGGNTGGSSGGGAVVQPVQPSEPVATETPRQ